MPEVLWAEAPGAGWPRPVHEQGYGEREALLLYLAARHVAACDHRFRTYPTFHSANLNCSARARSVLAGESRRYRPGTRLLRWVGAAVGVIQAGEMAAAGFRAGGSGAGLRIETARGALPVLLRRFVRGGAGRAGRHLGGGRGVEPRGGSGRDAELAAGAGRMGAACGRGRAWRRSAPWAVPGGWSSCMLGRRSALRSGRVLCRGGGQVLLGERTAGSAACR